MRTRDLIGEYRISILFMDQLVPGEWRQYNKEEFLFSCNAFAENHMYFEVEWR